MNLPRLFTAVAATVLLTASFGAQTAYAAAGPAPTPTSASPQQATPKPAKTSAATPKVPTPTKQQRAANGKAAFVHADVPDTCSGPLQPDILYPCSSIDMGLTNTYTVALAHAPDLVMIAVTTTDGSNLQATLTAPDSTVISCQQPVWAGPFQCPTTTAGTYTLQVGNAYGPETYTITYLPIVSDTSCTAVTNADLAFDVTARHGSLAAGAIGNCFSLNQPSGTVVRSITSAWNIQSSIYDATGTQVCSTTGACTLTGTAPYKVLINQANGFAQDYDWRLTRISNPTGCVAATPQPFNTVPTATTPGTCRALTVTTAGVYRLGALELTPDIIPFSGTVYNASGSVLCDSYSAQTCALPAGVSNYVLDTPIDETAAIATVFRGVADSRSCVTASDTGFADGPATGTLTQPGEEDCLILPTPAGKSVSMLNGRSATVGTPTVQVYDAAGALICDNSNYGYENCKLTGVAPFHAIVSAYTAGGYQILVQRTDSATGCTAWPQSGFGGSYGAQVTTTSTLEAACLSIPAGQHSASEMIDYSNTANRVDASVTVVSADGTQSCVGASEAVCPMTPGVAYTALVIGDPDTFQLVRRDVSSTATCSAPVSTTPGGASTAETFTSSLDARCIRVTAATGDMLLMGVRASSAVAPAGAVLEVMSNDGTILCRQFGVPCRVTGYTSYQVIVVASDYAGVSIPASVDIWRLGTSAGWAPQCTAHPLSMDGFAPVTMSVTESQTGYCGVVDVHQEESLGVYGATSAPFPEIPWVSMLTAANWADGRDYCGNLNYSDLAFLCQVQYDEPDAQAVVIVYPYEAQVPFTMTFQGVCYDGCTAQPTSPTITSVSPASGQAETEGQLVLHGTGLDMGDKVTLTTNGQPATYQTMSTPVSASADGTTLTVNLMLEGIAPAKYDVTVTSTRYAVGTLANAYTVTPAAPVISGDVFVPLTAKRILDTGTGLGAPKKTVAAGGVVKLTVAGAGGIPATGVTAVVLNVTASSPTAATYVTVYADGTTAPHTANLNVAKSQTLAVLTTVAAPNGKVDLRNNAGTVNLQADVIGYYTATGTGSALTTLRPARILDTRNGVGAPKAKIGAGGTAHLTVAGVGGIPSTGVTAVVLDLTATNATATSHVTVYPDGQAVPGIANLQFVKGRNASDLVIVPVVNGKVDLRNSAGSVDLLADVTGYFTAAGAGYHSVTPARIMDTRSGLGVRKGVIPANGTVKLTVAGAGGIPSTGVTAVLLTVSVMSPTVAGGLTVYADGTTLPGLPSLYFGPTQTINNLVVVPVVNGKIDFHNTSGSVQVVADVSGYYTS